MIIIYTKNGPRFVNNAEILQLNFNRESETVDVFPSKWGNQQQKPEYYMIEHVIRVRYVSDAKAIDYIYDGQTIEKLKREADEKEEELGRLLKKYKNQNKYFQGLLLRINARFPEILKEIEKEIDEENKILKKRQEQ